VTCKELQMDLDSVIDGQAPVDALFHLAICSPCRSLVNQLKFFHRYAASARRPIVPSELRSRIAGALESGPLRDRLERLEPSAVAEDESDLRSFF
jgi:hypothetical protein